jgi:hypothetical protein
MLSHEFLELFDSLLGVTVDQSLVDVQVSVKVDQDVHLPLLFLNSNVVLVDTFKSKLLVLNKNLCWFSATLPPEILQMTKHFMREPAKILVKY